MRKKNKSTDTRFRAGKFFLGVLTRGWGGGEQQVKKVGFEYGRGPCATIEAGALWLI